MTSATTRAGTTFSRDNPLASAVETPVRFTPRPPRVVRTNAAASAKPGGVPFV